MPFVWVKACRVRCGGAGLACRPGKEQVLLDAVMATLRGDGSVLMPIDTGRWWVEAQPGSAATAGSCLADGWEASVLGMPCWPVAPPGLTVCVLASLPAPPAAGRLLELVLLLERHWAEHRLTYPLVLLSAMAFRQAALQAHSQRLCGRPQDAPRFAATPCQRLAAAPPRRLLRHLRRPGLPVPRHQLLLYCSSRPYHPQHPGVCQEPAGVDERGADPQPGPRPGQPFQHAVGALAVVFACLGWLGFCC